MATKENIIMFAKDFFGEAIDATLYFYRNGDIIHATDFQDGYTIISIPDHLTPGVYDVVARRGTSEYWVNNFMISMSTHYFQHSRLHNDVRLTAENFKPGEVIEAYKFNPLVSGYISYINEDTKETFDNIARYNGNPNSIRWGGQIVLTDKVEIEAGAAVIDGDLVEWEDTKLDIPEDLGVYNIGIFEGELVIDTPPVDLSMAVLRKEGPDFVRMVVKLDYHTLYRSSNLYFFTDFEDQSDEVSMNMPSEEAIFGIVRQGKVFKGKTTLPVQNIKLKVVGNGPVLETDRLYLYATSEFFLLWEGPALMVVLPRWNNSYIKLNWKEDLYFVSWGSDGHTRWSIQRAYGPSHVNFKTGDTPLMVEEDLQKVIIGFEQISGDNSADWSQTLSGSASLQWT